MVISLPTFLLNVLNSECSSSCGTTLIIMSFSSMYLKNGKYTLLDTLSVRIFFLESYLGYFVGDGVTNGGAYYFHGETTVQTKKAIKSINVLYYLNKEKSQRLYGGLAVYL